MKVWFPTIKAGTGADIFIINLAQELEKNGIESEITWFPHYFELTPHILSKATVPTGTDIIHVNSWYGFAFSIHKLPLIVSVFHWVHDPALLKYKSIMQKFYHKNLIKKYESKSIESANVVTAISHFTGRQLKKDFPENEIKIVNTGIDITLFNIRKEEVKPNSQFNLLFVGTPSARKGFDLLERIMDKLPDNIMLYYISGKLKSRNAKRLGDLPLSELIKQYQQCDALILPTRYEGFGYVIAEAMACGKPVVATNCSAIPELIEHMENGMLCSIDNIDEFVDAVMFLEKNRSLVLQMGQNARNKIVEKFSIDNMTKKYIEIYKSVNR